MSKLYSLYFKIILCKFDYITTAFCVQSSRHLNYNLMYIWCLTSKITFCWRIKNLKSFSHHLCHLFILKNILVYLCFLTIKTFKMTTDSQITVTYSIRTFIECGAGCRLSSSTFITVTYYIRTFVECWAQCGLSSSTFITVTYYISTFIECCAGCRLSSSTFTRVNNEIRS